MGGYCAAVRLARSCQSCGAHLWHPGLDHRRRRARHGVAALELAALTQQQRAALPVRPRPALRACGVRARARVEG
eukprot:scaffold56914_cov63-Phaeocystis_antarctica.AAC.7